MRRHLPLFFTLLSLQFFTLKSFAFGVSIGDPAVTTTATRYRWSSDVNTLGKRTSWITNLNEPLIPTVNANTIYRVRMGANFNITVPYTYIGTTNAYIYSFSLENPIQFQAYYKKSSSSNWLTVPANETDGVAANAAFCMAPSSYINNATIIPNDEQNNLLVLPRVDTTSTAGRPANPYYFLGGKFYSTQSSSTNVGNIGYNIGTQNYINQAYFATTSYSTNVKVAPKQFLNMGAEIEASIKFLSGVAANTLYDVKIDLTIPFKGTGDASSTSDPDATTGSYSLDGTSKPIKTSLTGQFRTPAIILPVELTDFKVSNQGGVPKLTWTTKSEINNSGFNIQRGTDSKNFTTIGFVPSQVASGNSTINLDYSYPDNTGVGKGTLYYRLQQVDKDGRSTLSSVVPFNADGTATSITIGPNPVISNLNINNAEQGSTFTIYSASGQTMKSGIISSSTYSVDMPYFPAGMYILKITTKSGQQVSKKFFRQ